jgi:DNA-binding Lrp family transcriptional regulator
MIDIPIPFRILEEGKVDLTDIRILQALIEGSRITDVASRVGVAEKTVANRLEAMEKNGIILKKQCPVVDILRLYNYVFVAYVKVHLSAAIPEAATRGVAMSGTAVPYTPPPPSWHEVLDAIRKNDEALFKKIVRYAFVTMGTEWDVMLVISTQSIKEYAEFFSKLQKKGFIEKVEGHTIVSSAGYYYDPISVPDPDEIKSGLETAADYLQRQKGLEKNPEEKGNAT